MTYRMPRELYRQRWQRCAEFLGSEHPATRAAFGRYVATLGGVLSMASAGSEAWKAWCRARDWPGYGNRAARKHFSGAG